jgi:hypothetical protein
MNYLSDNNETRAHLLGKDQGTFMFSGCRSTLESNVYMEDPATGHFDTGLFFFFGFPVPKKTAR